MHNRILKKSRYILACYIYRPHKSEIYYNHMRRFAFWPSVEIFFRSIYCEASSPPPSLPDWEKTDWQDNSWCHFDKRFKRCKYFNANSKYWCVPQSKTKAFVLRKSNVFDLLDRAALIKKVHEFVCNKTESYLLEQNINLM